jgi:hypothetical protein
MEINKIKSFAKEARLLLLDGVRQRLKYWGFSADGSNDQDLQSTQGGYIFRGQIYTDTAVPSKWKALKTRLKDKQAVQDVLEEASYTWFNRLMAIKILEANGYLEPTLSFTEGMRTPLIVQNAKKGIHSLRSQADKDLLLEYLQEDKEEQAFGLLIADLCNRNKLLHDIFGRIDDYTEILLPQNLLQKDGVLDLINSNAISTNDYKEVELIGWLYQFYISDKKDEVFAGFKKNKKARAEDIPAATQIFTPKWIVKYMVENTVGKIYLDYEPTSTLRDEMKYLVDAEKGDQGLGIRDKQDTELIPNPSSLIPKTFLITDITELTLIDPASGSGHILVTGFELLFKMYREAGYTAKQAVDNILEYNLFGLDIDDRAMQLARFAVLLKAAKYYPEVLIPNPSVPIPKIYSFPEASHFTSEELQNFLGHDAHQYTAELKEALQLLNQGKNVGSALKIDLSKEAQQHIKQRYADWLELSKRAGLDIELSSIWNRLHPFLDVLLVLTKKYASVVANPPYMGQKSMNGELKDYVNTQYPLTKSDLFAVFMEVCLSLNVSKGLMGMINQHSWMFLSSYEKLREEILNNYSILNMLHLGPRTFEELSGEVVQSTAFVFENGNNIQEGTYFRLVDYRNNAEKEAQFLARNNRYTNIPQTNFSKIPGSPISYWASERVIELFLNFPGLSDVTDLKQGMASGDNNRFVREWYEPDNKLIEFNSTALDSVEKSNKKYCSYVKGGNFRKWYGNLANVIKFDRENFLALSNSGNKLPSKQHYFKEGGTWSLISSSSFGCRFMPQGNIFDVSSHCIFNNTSDDLFTFIAFLNSKISKNLLLLLNPTLNFSSGVVSLLPFKTSESKKQINLLSDIAIKNTKKDWDSRETSWDFEKSPLLKEAVSLGQAYQTWQEQVTQDFFQLHANEEELNRIFINIYGLQEELTPEVALKDITILQEELAPRNQKKKKGETEEAVNKTWVKIEEIYRNKGREHTKLPFLKDKIIGQLLSYGIGVFLGRYRLDKPGLNIAHPNPTEEELSKYQYNGHSIEIDEDGILPLMGEDCAFPDDALVRTKDLVHAVWGEDSLTENINFIHDALGMDLHKWLTEKFWGYHTSMYKKKPIYWLFSSNVKRPQNAAFKVLVYMHRMDKYTVQKIQRNYLHPHQEYIKREIEKLSVNEENLSKQEMKRLEQLRNWELECRDYNEVLKELANQQIEFDLDDGVDTNYAKFEGAVAKI